MLEGKVLKDFNDKRNNLKKYTAGENFKAENTRYKQLQAKGYVGQGREITTKNNK